MSTESQTLSDAMTVRQQSIDPAARTAALAQIMRISLTSADSELSFRAAEFLRSREGVAVICDMEGAGTRYPLGA